MKNILILILTFFILLSGCSGGKVEQSETSINEINVSDEKTQVLYEYAKDINMKNYSQAYEKLGTNLKKSYSGADDKAFANIDHMEIKKLVEKTGETGKWFANPREIGNVKECRVFYAEIEYTINNLITSYLKNGINYHKIIIAKEDSDSGWKICELSSVGKEE